MSDKEQARQSKAEAHKKMLKHLNSHDSIPRDHDAEKAEREKLILSPPLGLAYDENQNSG